MHQLLQLLDDVISQELIFKAVTERKNNDDDMHYNLFPTSDIGTENELYAY